MEWIKKYIEYWNAQDIDGIKSLFHRDYDYIDIPFDGPISIDTPMINKWGRPSEKANMRLRFFVSEGNKCAARVIYYRIHYRNDDGVEAVVEPKYGLYTKIMLFELDGYGKCTYLYEMQAGKSWCVEDDQNPDEGINRIPEYF